MTEGKDIRERLLCRLFKSEKVVGGVEYDIPRDEKQAGIKVTRELGG